jgi:hypothetical protein
VPSPLAFNELTDRCIACQAGLSLSCYSSADTILAATIGQLFSTRTDSNEQQPVSGFAERSSSDLRSKNAKKRLFVRVVF